MKCKSLTRPTMSTWFLRAPCEILGLACLKQYHIFRSSAILAFLPLTPDSHLCLLMQTLQTINYCFPWYLWLWVFFFSMLSLKSIWSALTEKLLLLTEFPELVYLLYQWKWGDDKNKCEWSIQESHWIQADVSKSAWLDIEFFASLWPIFSKPVLFFDDHAQF